MQNNIDLSNDLGVGVVNWKSAATLAYSLDSWMRNGLLDICSQMIIWVQEPDAEVKSVLKKRPHPKIKIWESKNIGIGRTWAQLLDRLPHKYILILEDDWQLTEGWGVTRERLLSAAHLLTTDNIKCIRLRHRVNYGDPLYTLHLKETITQPENLYWLADCIHWEENPPFAYPQYISAIMYHSELWYKFNNQHANFTANPCLYMRQFMMDILYPVCKASRGLKSIEIEMNPVWQANDFNVLAGKGLFTHKRLDQ